jgi:hypothetical protein
MTRRWAIAKGLLMGDPTVADTTLLDCDENFVHPTRPKRLAAWAFLDLVRESGCEAEDNADGTVTINGEVYDLDDLAKRNP